MTTGKTIALTIWILVDKMMSLLFNTLSRFVICFLPRNNCLLILWLQFLSTVIFENQENKICNYFHFSSFICIKWWDWMPWYSFFLFNVNFTPSVFSFTLNKRFFSSSSVSYIRVISSTYLIILLAILILTCASSGVAFHVMYSAYKSNKQGDNIQPWHIPFSIWNQSVACPVITVASWPAHRFLRRQVRWSGIPISWRIFHSLMWSTQSKA